MTARKKICVVTGSRAEYGLLRHLMALIRRSAGLELQLIATGTHLSKVFGETRSEIVADGFTIDREVDLALNADTPVGLSNSTARGVSGFAEAFAALKPDLIVVLGDRFEILAAATAAMFARIPIAHLHGGELSEGVIDDAIRHALTKFSHLHFVANEVYRRRVIQLGEQPERVFTVGGLGVDAIARVDLMPREALERDLGFTFGARNLLVTFHPATLDAGASATQTAELLAALSALSDTRLIFTLPNADTDGRAIINLIEAFVARNPNARLVASLGQRRYFSCLRLVDGVVGNSSSGLIEAPSFKIGTVNIGDRQRGRLRAASVIDCAPRRDDIGRALDRLFSSAFRASLAGVVNPYGVAGAPERIVAVLDSADFGALLKKTFYDLPQPGRA